jgi:ABC-type multidrug transport system fused ATPase/permease subunit
VRRLLDIIRRAYAQIGTERRWRWWVLGGVSLAMTAVEAVGATLVYLLVALISDANATVQVPLLGDLATRFPTLTSRQLRAGAAVAVGVFFVGRGAVRIAQTYVRNRLVSNSSALLAGQLLDGYLDMPYLFHTRKSSAELIRNTYGGVQKLLNGIVLPSISIVTDAVLALGLLVTLVALAPVPMLVTSVALGGTLWLVQGYVRPRLVELGARSEEASKRSLAAIQQVLGGIRDIKLLRREDAFSRIHIQQRLILSRSSYVSSSLSSLSPVAIETSLILAIVGVFVLTTTGTGGGSDALPTLALFAYVGLRIQPVLQGVISHVNSINGSIALLEIIERDRREIAEWQAAVAEEAARHPVDAGARGAFTTAIRLEGVTFRYRDENEPVLVDVDLTIRRGEFIGICGPTGGGKSTLVDLIVGLLQPTEGTVTVDGEPLGRRPLWWWDQLGVVSQAVFLTDDTLRRNIAFGTLDDADIDEDRLERCVRRAQLAPVVADLPEGLDTVVGERGIRLSGGQRQRVAIARALYREPEVLILDEGTSALDGATERALVQAIDEATHERTLIAIAHRISTIRSADRILVVSGGRVVDQGTHDELLGRSELFQALA